MKVLVTAILFIVLVSLACGTSDSSLNSTYPTTTTKVPGSIDCIDVFNSTKDMTSFQRENYPDSVRDKSISFAGTVSGVSTDGEVSFEENNDESGLCQIWLDKVPSDVALGLNKGQHIEGYGKVKSINYLSVLKPPLMIIINVNPDSLIIH
jgi:hypothetical protein